MKKNESGLSLIELLIGMVLASMVFIVSSSLVISTMNYSTKSKEGQVLTQTKNDLAAEFSNNIRWADVIDISEDNRKLDLTGSANISYSLDSDSIFKSGERLTPSSVKVTKFEVKPYATSIGITVEMESKRNSGSKDSLMMILAPRIKDAVR